MFLSTHYGRAARARERPSSPAAPGRPASRGDPTTSGRCSLAAPEPDPVGLPREELLAYLRSHPTVSLWPFTGRALGASRSLTYQMGRRDEIRVLRLGQHRCRVASSWLERQLGLGKDS